MLNHQKNAGYCRIQHDMFKHELMGKLNYVKKRGSKSNQNRWTQRVYSTINKKNTGDQFNHRTRGLKGISPTKHGDGFVQRISTLQLFTTYVCRFQFEIKSGDFQFCCFLQSDTPSW